jgi:hypothetical protein
MTLVFALMLHGAALWMAVAAGYGLDQDRQVSAVFLGLGALLSLLGVWLAF